MGGSGIIGRTALVTGSVGGLGSAIADTLAAAGCRLVLNGLDGMEAGDAASRRLAEAHGVEVLFDGAAGPGRRSAASASS